MAISLHHIRSSKHEMKVLFSSTLTTLVLYVYLVNLQSANPLVVLKKVPYLIRSVFVSNLILAKTEKG